MTVRLSLPQGWVEDPERLKRARVPADMTFETKTQIALDLPDQARAWNMPHRDITADADDEGGVLDILLIDHNLNRTHTFNRTIFSNFKIL